MRLVLRHARQCKRAALSRVRRFGLLVLRVDAAHPHRTLAGPEPQFVADTHRAAEDRAGHDGADARQREGAVHGEAESQIVFARVVLACDIQQPRAQRVDALAGGSRHREHRRVRERRGREQRRDLCPHLRNPRRIDAVGLGDRHRGIAHAEQRHHGQVLARLWHHAVVGRHHEQRMVDAGRAGQHGVQQALVARHIDETQRHAVGRMQVRVAQFDGDAAPLLFGQPVGVHAGERAHQRGLAVVDVACGADDHRVGPVT
jgi:hypothetical protein